MEVTVGKSFWKHSKEELQDKYVKDKNHIAKQKKITLLGIKVAKDAPGLEFPGGPVVKNLPANIWDMGSILGPERAHMSRSN